MRELDKLRQAADYTSCDRTGLAGWLSDQMPELRRYTYQMLKAGITLPLLPQLSNKHLLRDCRIYNGVHRLVITQAAKRNCRMLFYLTFTCYNEMLVCC